MDDSKMIFINNQDRKKSKDYRDAPSNYAATSHDVSKISINKYDVESEIAVTKTATE